MLATFTHIYQHNLIPPTCSIPLGYAGRNQKKVYHNVINPEVMR